MSTEPWSRADWQEQLTNMRLMACPQCQREGFFGVRAADDGRRYWLCKFCGHYREIGKEPVQLRPTAHGCPNHVRFLDALYVQWVQPHEDPFVCEPCKQSVAVADALVTRPADDKTHPWWQFPQGLTTDEAVAFWAKAGRPATLYL